MAAGPTTIPPITPDLFAGRMAALFPPGWSSAEAKTPGGTLNSVMKMLGGGLSFEIDAINYANGATRIPTAQGQALDIASMDYFGEDPALPVEGLPPGTQVPTESGISTSLYAIPRLPGEEDAAYVVRLLANLLPAGATRPAVTAAVAIASGFAPRVVEPWRPADTGVWDPSPGTAMAFWDVDTPQNPFRWTDQSLAYQGFINAVLPIAKPFGNNPTPCYDTVPFFWDVPNQYGIYFIDPPGSAALGSSVVYGAINRTKCFGTIVWVQFVSPPPPASWDEPGISWDQSGVVWQ